MIGGRDIGLLVGSFTMTGELNAGYPLLEACLVLINVRLK